MTTPALIPRDAIARLEAAMLAMPQVEIETRHDFAAGLYARTIVIPAGVALTGKVHLEGHLNMVSKGRITVWTEEGMRTIDATDAPAILASEPGMKRVGYAHEETVWTTIHANPEDLRDIAALERALVVGTVEEFEALMRAPVLEIAA